MPVRRTLSVLVLSAMLLACGWMLMVRGMALALAKTSPVAALAWYPGNPEALVRINETESDAAAKASRARAVLTRRPMDGRAYRQLAEIEIEAGRIDAARALYRIAGRHSPRDRRSQAWLADDALARGAVPEMISRIGLLVSMDASLRPALFAYLIELAAHDEVLAALVDVLTDGAGWREEFLATWSEQESAGAGLDRMFRALVEAGATLSIQERARWVDHLIGQRRWVAARRAWAAGIGPQRRDDAGRIFNGGFEAEPAGAFDWRFTRAPGSRIDTLATAGAHGDRALRIEFADRRVDFADVEQLMVLPPGKYSFQVRVRLDDLRTERGLAWRVRCLADDALLASGPALHGTRGWHLSFFTFNVPEDCRAQALRLELPARTAIERTIGGVAWFDDAAIIPIKNTPQIGGVGPKSGLLPSTTTVPEDGPDISADARTIPPPPLGPGRTLEIVGSIVNTVPNAADNRDPDVPVAP